MRKGMTLAEILVAAGVILLLGVPMLLGVLDARRRERDGAVVSAARQAQAAVETYRAMTASYPGAAADLPADDAGLAEAFEYRAEPAGCAPDASETCRSYVLRFTLEGRVGTLPGGACEVRPAGGITCVRR
ncbi:MAG: type II secretion system protein [Patescibacteria group bacterium]